MLLSSCGDRRSVVPPGEDAVPPPRPTATPSPRLIPVGTSAFSRFSFQSQFNRSQRYPTNRHQTTHQSEASVGLINIGPDERKAQEHFGRTRKIAGLDRYDVCDRVLERHRFYATDIFSYVVYSCTFWTPNVTVTTGVALVIFACGGRISVFVPATDFEHDEEQLKWCWTPTTTQTSIRTVSDKNRSCVIRLLRPGRRAFSSRVQTLPSRRQRLEVSDNAISIPIPRHSHQITHIPILSYF